MLHKTFNNILKNYALINNKGNYKRVPQTEKNSIESDIYYALSKNPTFRMLYKSNKILVKGGSDRRNGFKIFIGNTNYCNTNFRFGPFILYSFENDGSKITLSLKQGDKTLNLDGRRKLAEKLKSTVPKLKGFTKKTASCGEFYSDAIILRTYDVKKLNDKTLEDDLKLLYEVYYSICTIYKQRLGMIHNQGENVKNKVLEQKKMELSKYFKDIITSNGKLVLDENVKQDITHIILDIIDSFKGFSSSKKYFQISFQDELENKNCVKIYIWNYYLFDLTFNQGLYIILSLSKSEKNVSLSIEQGLEFPSSAKKRSIARDYKRKIVYNHKFAKKIAINDLKKIVKYEDKSESIAYKRYGSSFNGDVLGKDLEILFKLYNNLCPNYKQRIEQLTNDIDGGEIESNDDLDDVTFYKYLIDKGYFFSKKIIEDYLLSLKVKPFIILTGNSGTGKTKLSQLFAEFLKSSSKSRYVIVPVGANWTENRNVVGYYNVLTKSYQHTSPLDLILRANEDVNEPYFLILDEMNLSHVERYFSDFLSAMESEKPIHLHKVVNVEDVPQELTIPNNVFIVGTVNVDETTYMFSPKVLDRANVLEFKTFKDISIRDYVKIISPKIEFEGDVDYLENPLSDIGLRENILSVVNGHFSDIKCNVDEIIENDDGVAEAKVVESYVLLEISRELTKFNGYLVGSGFEFGYRTVNEILAFMVVAWKYEGEQYVWDNWRRYFDAQILQKILPKLHGSQIVLGKTLDNLLTHCLGVDSVDEINDLSKLDLNELNAPYLESAKKLIQMKNVLEKQRYVSFIN